MGSNGHRTIANKHVELMAEDFKMMMSAVRPDRWRVVKYQTSKLATRAMEDARKHTGESPATKRARAVAAAAARAMEFIKAETPGIAWPENTMTRYIARAIGDAVDASFRKRTRRDSIQVRLPECKIEAR